MQIIRKKGDSVSLCAGAKGTKHRMCLFSLVPNRKGQIFSGLFCNSIENRSKYLPDSPETAKAKEVQLRAVV